MPTSTVLPFVLLATMLSVGTLGWEVHPSCLHRRQLRLGGTTGLGRNDDAIDHKSDSQKTQAGLPSTDTTTTRSLQQTTGNDVFLIKMFWEEGYCWQEEIRERRWCMQCRGVTCVAGDKLWIQKCSANVATQQFQWLADGSDATGTLGRLKTASANLCLERVSRTQFDLAVCDTSNTKQLLKGFDTTGGPFELHPQGSDDLCMNQHHHPKPAELIYGETCKLARIYHTNRWSTYQAEQDGMDNSLYQRTPPCTDDYPCGNCEGDCDRDSHCMGDLKCYDRRKSKGNEDGDIPGCMGTGRTGWDYCYMSTEEDSPTDPPSTSLTLTNVSPECSKDSPCPVCHGDCDNDDQCAGTLKCYDRRSSLGNQNGPVPGCEGTGRTGHDYCYQPTEDTTSGTAPTAAPNQSLSLTDKKPQCSKDSPCDKCAGDCDNDDECTGNLQCFQRFGKSALMEVPGCGGTGTKGLDYCFDPADSA